MYLKKLFAAIVSVAIVVCSLAVEAGAQNNYPKCWGYISCGIYSLWPGPNSQSCNPGLPATAYDCDSPGGWTLICKVKTTACPPRPQIKSCEICSNPIDLADGNVFIAQTDIRIPGLGGGLALTRTWNSIPAYNTLAAVGIFGPKWTSNFEEKVYPAGDGYMKYFRGDGSIWSFGWAGQSGGLNYYGVASPAPQVATLTQGTTIWTITFQSGEQRTFDRVSGLLLSIADRNGNTTQLTYDSQNRLTTVTDSASRHLNFNYLPSSTLVSSVTSDFGTTLSYAYDGQGRLSTVTEPDNSTISFTYTTPLPGGYTGSFITSITDSNNRTLESHTYDVYGRGLSASRANGVEGVTINYGYTGPPPLCSGDC